MHSWGLKCSTVTLVCTKTHTPDLSVLRVNIPCRHLLSGLKQMKAYDEGTCGVLLHSSAPLVVCGCAVALPCSQWVIHLLHHPMSQQPNVVWACCSMLHTGLPGQPLILTHFQEALWNLRDGNSMWRLDFCLCFATCTKLYRVRFPWANVVWENTWMISALKSTVQVYAYADACVCLLLSMFSLYFLSVYLLSKHFSSWQSAGCRKSSRD